MLRGQRFRLYPTQAQATYFARACGVTRFSYNWGLALRQRYYRLFKKSLSSARLQKHWNKVKACRFPWAAEVTKHAHEQAFRALDAAYVAFFAGRSKFPRFKRKGVNDSFCAGRGQRRCFRFDGNLLVLPKVGAIRFRNALRWPTATPKQVRVCRRADQWFATVLFDIPAPPKLPAGRPTCGIDLGCTTFATVSSQGVITDEVKPPKPYAKAKRRLRRLGRAVSRKAKGGANRKKAVVRLARQHMRVANVRRDFLHQLTTRLVRRFGVIVLEDLNVRGMVKNRTLAGTISDLGWSEFRRQVTYKAAAAGTRVVFADRFFPSSKRCSACGYVFKSLVMSCRQWACDACGADHDRDHNAAKNLEQLGRGTPEVTPAETGVRAV